MNIIIHIYIIFYLVDNVANMIFIVRHNIYTGIFIKIFILIVEFIFHLSLYFLFIYNLNASTS
jgi:hypothetical protein